MAHTVSIVREVHRNSNGVPNYSTMDVFDSPTLAYALIRTYAEKYHEVPQSNFRVIASDDILGFTILEYEGKSNSYGIDISWEILVHRVKTTINTEEI